MSILLNKFPIAYFSTPKVACTSIKTALYELEFGRPWVDFLDENRNWVHIHNCGWFREEPMAFERLSSAQDVYKFAVIRDPIQRFLSAYGNRVVHHRELSKEMLDEAGVAHSGFIANPSLSTFIANLEDYRAISPSIRHHTASQSDFLGKDLAYFDRVYRFDEIGLIAADLEHWSGRAVSLPHTQFAGPKYTIDDLSEREIEKIFQIYRVDYVLMNGIYSAPWTALWRR